MVLHPIRLPALARPPASAVQHAVDCLLAFVAVSPSCCCRTSTAVQRARARTSDDRAGYQTLCDPAPPVAIMTVSSGWCRRKDRHGDKSGSSIGRVLRSPRGFAWVVVVEANAGAHAACDLIRVEIPARTASMQPASFARSWCRFRMLPPMSRPIVARVAGTTVRTVRGRRTRTPDAQPWRACRRRGLAARGDDQDPPDPGN